MRRVLGVVFVAALALGAVAVMESPAWAPPPLPACPQNITTDTTLSGDCAGPLTITGSDLTVDLGGHSVRDCESSFVDGVTIDGNTSGVRVRNGTVTGCGFGVIVEGTGNQVVGVTAADNAAGMNVGGTGNVVTRSAASDNGAQGLGVSGTDNRVVLNQLARNGEAGIVLYDATSRNAVALNRTTGNKYGIQIVAPASRNTLVLNAALDNTDFDLEDENANCDANRWLWNRFRTSNQSCIH